MMRTRLRQVIGQLRQPAYTGRNRCVPCTVVNLAIGGGLSLVGWTIEPSIGIATAAASMLLIYFRGYLVPGTPRLTKRYLPARVLGWFDKRPSPAQTVDVERFLTGGGVVVEGTRDLELDPEFREAWYDRMRSVAGRRLDTERVATLFEVPEAEITLNEYDEAVAVNSDGVRIAQWESGAAFVADIAAADTLDGHHPEWSVLSVPEQTQVLGALRLFLDRCPTCGGAVMMGEAVTGSCCRSIDVIETTCQACGSRLFETPYDPDTMA